MSKIVLTISLIFLLWSCNSSEKRHINDGINEIEISTKTIQEANRSLNSIDNKINTLRRTKPIKKDELIKVFPKEILSFVRTEYHNEQSNTTMDIVIGDATYNDHDKKINVTITDGAGETGSAMVSIMMIALHSDIKKIHDNGFEETGILHGRRAIFKEERLIKDNSSKISCSIQYITRDRYAISLSSDHIKLDELKKFNQYLKLDQLP